MHSVKKAKKSSTNTQAPTKENMNKFLKDPNIPTSNHNMVPNHNLQHPTHYSSPNSSNYENNPQTSNNPTHIFTSTNPLIVTSFNNHIIPQPASHHHNPTSSYNSNSAYPLIPLTPHCSFPMLLF